MRPRFAPLHRTGPRVTKPIAAAALATALVAGSGIWYLARDKTPVPPLVDLDQDLGKRAVGATTGTMPDLETKPPAVTKWVEVSRGDTLMALLVKAGVERGDAHNAITALSKVFSPRDLKPGQAIHLAFAATNNPATNSMGPQDSAAQGNEAAPLVSLSLQPSVDREVQVARSATHDEFQANTIDRPLSRILSAGSGTIVSSLFIAGQQAEVPGPVMIELIRAYSFDVDFQREIQKDDQFELLYESFADINGRLARTGDILFAALTLSGQRLELYRFTPGSGRTDFFDAKGQSVRKTLMRTPIDGARISSGYGKRRHPVLGYTKMHRGTDFSAPRGTPVYAAGDGVIERAGRYGAYGNYIRIRHNGTYKTAYAHLNGYAKGVRGGKRVKQGQVVGYVGSTGRSTGPHLHYEVHVNGRQTNPLSIKLPSGESLKGADLEAFHVARTEIERLYHDTLESTLIADIHCRDQAPEGEASTEAPAPAGGSCP